MLLPLMKILVILMMIKTQLVMAIMLMKILPSDTDEDSVGVGACSLPSDIGGFMTSVVAVMLVLADWFFIFSCPVCILF